MFSNDIKARRPLVMINFISCLHKVGQFEVGVMNELVPQRMVGFYSIYTNLSPN
jgi:hypothetical protein